MPATPTILASGQSKRFNSKKPKQFNIYKNKALFKHSLEKAMKSKLFKKIILVVNNKKSIKEKFPKNVSIIKGGKERSDSSLIALKYIKKFKPNNVLIHDAARPNFTIKLLKTLLRSLKNNKAVIPSINSNLYLIFFRIFNDSSIENSLLKSILILEFMLLDFSNSIFLIDYSILISLPFLLSVFSFILFSSSCRNCLYL